MLLPFMVMAGTLIALWITRTGIGLDNDGVFYVSAARNLVQGHGLSVPFGANGSMPLTHYPPGFPITLALAGLFGLDPLAGARWMNAALFGANIWLVAYLVRRVSPPLGPAMWGAVLTLTSTVMLSVHTRAWSEPGFLFLSFSSLLFLAEFLQNFRTRWLTIAGLLAALAAAFRYSGIALVITGVIAILLWAPDWRRRIRWCALFTAFPILTGLAISLRNFTVSGNVANRQFMLHPVEPSRWRALLDNVSTWILPEPVPLVIRAAVLALLASAVFLVARRVHKRGVPMAPLARLQPILLLFAACYLLTLIASIALVDVAIQFSYRILAPVFMALLIVVLQYAGRFQQLKVPRMKLAGTVVMVLLAVVFSVRMALWLRRANDTGLGYSGSRWKNSDIVACVKAIDNSRPVYSNAAPALYILTGKSVNDIPRKLVFTSGNPRPDYAADLLRMRKDLSDRQGVVVYLNVYGDLSQTFGMKPVISWPSEDELQSQIPLRQVRRAGDGTVYEVRH